VSYGALFFSGPGDIVWVCAWIAGTGIGSGVGSIVGPSIQADVIDYDEYVSGERKEGAYVATWNFVRKAAAGIAGALAGITLQWIGFVPNVEQTEATKLAILVLYALFPAAGMAIGVSLFFRFRFTEEEHARIRGELDARAAAEGSQ
jgi:GPH family glycoside/pentoside/hexuronide:cation symporter